MSWMEVTRRESRRALGLLVGVGIASALVAGCSQEGKVKPGAVTKNSLGMAMVKVPAGKFQMGSDASDAMAQADERPAHPVQITRAFEISANEVTVDQFRAFVKATQYVTEAERDPAGGWAYDPASGKPRQVKRCSWRNPGFEQGADSPVVEVSWEDAGAFCAWLGKQEGRTYRLPTEAEWEYACRAGTTTRFWTGDDAQTLQGAANVADRSQRGVVAGLSSMAPWNDSHPFARPVGAEKANPFGLYDMSGNVREWCADWYGADAYASSPAKDPHGPTDGSTHVTRGGAWVDGPERVRSAQRGMETVPFGSAIGFRIVREI
ncbi:MAG: formylglycine-generating enzyme family protein [Candidatus Eisenbacteria bacterium]|uniref:Formylglycine-generating enzyme family protein n=1 Tax=Eiseniibacteriota bacterium TaxID=2212470 RepID=A0A956LZC7_UNCEI|nr:formylglycine-generating enzyme family protein [Candidatus Eisenbacteria bacterium]